MWTLQEHFPQEAGEEEVIAKGQNLGVAATLDSSAL